MKNEEVKNLLFRYFLLLIFMFIILSESFVDLISKFLTYVLYLFFFYLNPIVIGNTISFGDIIFSIVEECIAPSAYLLIAIVFLTLPLNLKKIGNLIGVSYVYFTLFNLFRMIVLILIYLIFGIYYFDALHLIFYQIVSGLITALIIIYLLRKEKVKKVYPVYSDFKKLFRLVLHKKFRK